MNQLIDAQNRVTRWPRKAADRQRVLQHMLELFETGRTYSEKEVNEILNAAHNFADWALLRRELYEAGMLARDPATATYWVK